jgi:SAM-dependent methyltransferase
MKYYHSTTRGIMGVAEDDVTYARLAQPVAINTLIEPAHGAENLHAVYATAPGQRGVGFLAAFKAGALHTASIKLRLGSASAIRLEVHGQATRMHKAVVTIASDGSILSQAEEVNGVEIDLCADGTMDIRMSFVPFRSMIEWFYAFAVEERCEAESEADEILFAIGAFRLRANPAPLKFRSMAHESASIRGGVIVACQNLIVLRNYVHVQFEIHKPGAKLAGLDLVSAHPVAHAQWWTWSTPLTKMRGTPASPSAVRLKAQKPSAPVPSPALIDLLGFDFAHEGHVITLLCADLLDFSRMNVEESDKACQIEILAHFDDGSSHAIDVLGQLRDYGDEDPWIPLVEHHLESLTHMKNESMPFLEAGARGIASVQMRQLVSAAGWRYLGLDILPHENVDIVGDAHRMGPAVANGSVAAVYSSEVMEHLVSPVDFVLECNRILAEGGLFIARMPTIWPLHAEPWDFWRISQHGWQGLLNRSSGFEIIDICEFGQTSVVPSSPVWSGASRMAQDPAPLLSGVIARKIGQPQPQSRHWSADIAFGQYDHA